MQRNPFSLGKKGIKRANEEHERSVILLKPHGASGLQAGDFKIPINQFSYTGRMAMAKGLVAFATEYYQTQRIAEFIGERMCFEGFDADVLNAADLRIGHFPLDEYDPIVLGSATYHGEMLPAMKTVLFLAAKANLEGKTGGAFGAFGWSGEASRRIFDTMTHVFKMNMAPQALMLKSAEPGGAAKMARDYGRETAKKSLASIKRILK
jgi:flavorubredoxin